VDRSVIAVQPSGDLFQQSENPDAKLSARAISAAAVLSPIIVEVARDPSNANIPHNARPVEFEPPSAANRTFTACGSF